MCSLSMNETRKKIIIKEIQCWKDSRMLPEHYCDYLLALYTEGNHEVKSVSHKHSFPYIYFVLVLVFVSTLIVNYFTEIMPLMQISLFLIFLGLLLGISFYEFTKCRSILLPLSMAMFILLLMSIKLYESFVPGQLLYLYGGLFLNCLLWLGIGYKLNIIYYTMAGILSSLIILYVTLSYFGYI